MAAAANLLTENNLARTHNPRCQVGLDSSASFPPVFRKLSREAGPYLSLWYR